MPVKVYSTKIPWKFAQILPIAVLALILGNQVTYSHLYGFYNLHIGDEQNFKKIHEEIRQYSSKPDIILSPEKYYTWLKTSIPSRQLFMENKFPSEIVHLAPLEAWIICSGDGYTDCRHYATLENRRQWKLLAANGNWALYKMPEILAATPPDTTLP